MVQHSAEEAHRVEGLFAFLNFQSHYVVWVELSIPALQAAHRVEGLFAFLNFQLHYITWVELSIPAAVPPCCLLHVIQQENRTCTHTKPCSARIMTQPILMDGQPRLHHQLGSRWNDNRIPITLNVY